MNYASLILYMLITCFTPGPNNIMCMYLGANGGLRASRRFMTASILCFAAKALFCGFLNVALADVLPGIVPYLKWLGAAYMLYLALHILMDGFRKGQKRGEAGGREAGYRDGALMQLLNIKSWMGSLSVFSIYVVPYTTAAGAILLVSGINTLLMTAAGLTWCLFGSAVRRIYAEHIKIFSVVMAVSLVWCAYTALV